MKNYKSLLKFVENDEIVKLEILQQKLFKIIIVTKSSGIFSPVLEHFPVSKKSSRAHINIATPKSAANH